MKEEWNLINPELALAELSIQLMLPQSLQHEPQMLFMLYLCLGEDQNIINENHHKDIQIIHENHVHQVHEKSRGLVKPKDMTVYSYSPYLQVNAVTPQVSVHLNTINVP